MHVYYYSEDKINIYYFAFALLQVFHKQEMRGQMAKYRSSFRLACTLKFIFLQKFLDTEVGVKCAGILSICEFAFRNRLQALRELLR